MPNNNTKAVRASSNKRSLNTDGFKLDLRGVSSRLFLIVFACLILGALVGGLGFYVVTKNDCFEMVAIDGEVDVNLGGENGLTIYQEPGVKCISFNKNVANSVSIKYLYREDISHDTQEVTAIDPSVAGFYYVVYTSSNFKYKNVQLIRNVAVYRAEDVEA